MELVIDYSSMKSLNIHILFKILVYSNVCICTYTNIFYCYWLDIFAIREKPKITDI